MMNRSKSNVLLGLGLTFAAPALLIAGCGEEQAQVVQAPPPPAPPQAPPMARVTSIADLMVELGIDSRIHLPENMAPRTDEDRIAVLEFLNGFAVDNPTTVKEMLAFDERATLQRLLDTGRWDDSVGGIDHVMVVTGQNTNTMGVGSSTAGLAVLAIFTVNGDLEPTMWYLHQDADGPAFEAAPTPPDILNRISGADMIGAWHDILDEERTRGSQTDIDEALPQQILEQRRRRDGGGSQPNPGQPAPPGIPAPGSPAPSPGSPPI